MKRATHRYFFFLFLFLVVGSFVSAIPKTAIAQAQRDNLGTDFYVAFGPNEGGEGNNPTRNVDVLYITSRAPAQGKIEIPALNFFRTFTSKPGVITTIALPNGNNNTPTVELQDDQAEKVIPGLAVHITSDSEVAVFGLNHKLYSTDAFMAMPVDVLGTEYRAICYVTSNYRDLFHTPGEFWVIAVQDSTNLTVTLRDNSSMGTLKNVPRQVRLNKGDIWLVQGTEDLTNDLTGSLIEADQPIAVFSGHRRTQIPYDALGDDGQPSRNHLVEQLPPVSAWGDSALVVPYATSASPDLVRIVAAEDQTDVTINGVPIGKTLNAGDFYEITQLQGVSEIHATKPIQVGQYLHSSKGALGSRTNPAYGDPALALVFPVEQFTTSYTVISIVDPSSFTGNFVNIVAEANSINTMKVDGQPIDPAEFKLVPNSRYAYAQHRLQQGTHNLTGATPFGITIYALGPVDGYAYTGGTLLKTITPLKTVGLSIDFGDRVLDAAYNGKFDTVVELRNVSEDVVNIYSFPRHLQDTTKFHVVDPPTPYVLQPNTAGKMTIEFEPKEINRRMHTQVTAKTDHLRAYVVDVYGRGVIDDLGVFRDPDKINSIDVLDFGVFTNLDAPSDSVVYIGNAGLAALKVDQVGINGTNASDFALGVISAGGTATNVPFTILKAPSGSVSIGVRFIPSGANGNRTATLQIVSSTGQTHTVILKARIETIAPLSTPLNIKFDSTLVCDETSYDIQLTNPNDLPIVLNEASIVGPNAGDFVVASAMPLTVPPGKSSALRIKFLPTARGQRKASAILTFNLPKNRVPDTVALSATSDKRRIEFFGRLGVSAHAEDPFLVPVYCLNDLAPYSAIGYTMHVKYDSAYLELLDVVTANTITPNGSIALYTSRGHDTVEFNPVNNAQMTGGGVGSLPLIFLKFQAHYSGEDPQTFTKNFDISYDVDLRSSKIPVTCIDQSYAPGSVEILSVCSQPHLVPEQGSTPKQMMLEQSNPNPFNPSTTMEYDVATEGPVKIAVYDDRGVLVRVLVDAVKTPGYYHATFDADDLPSGAYSIMMNAGDYHRIRRVILKK